MCSQYTIKTSAKKIADLYQLALQDLPEADLDDHVFPHRQGWVVTKDGLRRMNYSLIPVWSKERRPKFSTHNARLEEIETKPTWKGPFVNRHCVVPISAFIEPIRQGEHNGFWVGFSSGDNILSAAGLYSEWVDKETGEIIPSFAMITKDPYPFVEKTGHDRSPLLLTPESAKSWLKNEGEDPLKLKEFLKAGTCDYKEFEVVNLKELKKA